MEFSGDGFPSDIANGSHRTQVASFAIGLLLIMSRACLVVVAIVAGLILFLIGASISIMVATSSSDSKSPPY